MLNLYFGLIFLVGICLGSFVNMWDFRKALEYGLIRRKNKLRTDLGGRSYCDYCGKSLRVWDNIPLLSWILLGGKTSCCSKKLPLLYPLVELALGIMLVVNFYLAKNLALGILGAAVLTVMTYEFVFDLKYMILPEDGVKVLYGLAILWQIILGNWCGSFLLAMILGWAFIGGIYFLTSGKGMGWGDVELSGFIGLFLGLKGMMLGMYVAFVVGAIVSIVLLVLKKAGPKTKIPFGPFLLFGTLLSFWGMIKL